MWLYYIPQMVFKFLTKCYCGDEIEDGEMTGGI
jgi:hypothetical protein